MSWYLDENNNHTLKDNNGNILFKIKPLYLPDKTLFEPDIPYRVKALQNFYDTDGTVIVNYKDEIIAIRTMDSIIHLFRIESITKSYMALLHLTVDEEVEIEKQFEFLDVQEIPTIQELKLKLDKCINIENYEYCQKIQTEINKRNESRKKKDNNTKS